MDDQTPLSPGAAVILAAARERDIPVQRLSEDLFQLGQGARQHRFCGAETEGTAAIAKTIAHDKEMARTLMQSVGVPVVYGRPVNDADDAWAAAQEMGLPAIVKPQYTGYGWTSTANLNTREEVLAAYAVLRKETGYIMVEHSAPGDKYRLLVVGERVIAACRCDAPSINDEPTMTDVLSTVDPGILLRAVDAARVVGLDMGAVGVIAADIRQPLEEQEGVVFGVQPAPDLTPYVKATPDRGQSIGRAIVAARFPEGQTGRIPIVAVSGEGAARTAQLIAHIVRAAGQAVGLATSEGYFVDGRQISDRNSSSAGSAQAVLMNPLVEAALLEVGGSGAKAEQLGFDRCDVAVLDTDGNPAVLNAVSPSGAAVLSAAAPNVTKLAAQRPGAVLWSAADNAVVAAHLGDGGRAALVRNGQVILARGKQEEALLPATELKSSPNLHHVLGAAAAAWALGIPTATIGAALVDFAANDCNG